MSRRSGVSVMLIAKDEAARLERALKSVGWADEIVVVVDAASTDDTEALARRLGATVTRETFRDFASQRQRALDLATREWGLWMDCDEIVSESLADEIRGELVSPRFAAYRIPRLDRMFGREIRHGGWFPQYHLRLFRTEGARWRGAVHERIEFAGPLGTLRGVVHHDSHSTIGDWVGKMVRYTPLEAEAWWHAGRRVGPLGLLVEPLAYFGYKYVVQQGWRDGGHGLVLACLMGCYRLLALLRLWDLQRAAR